MHFLYSSLKAFSILFLLSFSACFLTAELGHKDESAVLDLNDKAPIILSLSQGYVADSVLHLRVQLEFLDSVNTDSIYVQLKGLKKDVVYEEQTLPVSNFVDTSVLKTGSKIYIPFTLAIGDIDRFTLSCSFGEAGYQLAAKLDLVDIDSPPKIENKIAHLPVIISELRVFERELPCNSSLCSVRVDLEGRVLRGNKSIEVKSVALAYKLVWVPDGEVPNVAESKSNELEADEKMLPFGDELLPLDGFEFEVKGDKDLPKIPGGRFIPIVRILRFENLGSTNK